MQVTRIAPSAPLAPWLRCYTIVETASAGMTRTLLPERGLVIGFRFAGAAHLEVGGVRRSLDGTSVTGIQPTTRRMHTEARSGIVLAMFRPAGAMRFFDAPLDALFGGTHTLDALVPPAELRRVEDQIGSARDHAARIAHLERFLRARLRPAADPVVTAAVAAIGATHGTLRIAALARRLGISQDPLEKRFRRAVGTSPKQLASLVRLLGVIDPTWEPRGRPAGRPTNPTWEPAGGEPSGTPGRAPGDPTWEPAGPARPGPGDPTWEPAAGRRPAPSSDGGGAPWSRRAIAAGYFDQSHFNRAFRALTGASPRAFFATGGAFCGEAHPREAR